jgi:hypothetical protein
MARKPWVSSQPVRLKRVRSEDIVNRQWSEQDRLVLRRTPERQAGKETDVPTLSAEQLAAVVQLRDARKA